MLNCFHCFSNILKLTSSIAQHEKESFDDFSIFIPIIIRTERVPIGMNELSEDNFHEFPYFKPIKQEIR